MEHLESLGENGLGLRLVLQRLADRVAHQIEVLQPAGTGAPRMVLPCLHSVEGTSCDDWPASPPLQSASLEITQPGQKAAFLVGLAGRSHWSACYEAIPERGEIVLDFACRAQSRPVWLGTTYRVADTPSGSGVSLEPGGAAISLNLAASRLWIRGEPAGQFPPPRMTLAGEGGVIRCQSAESAARYPATLRWRYRIGICPS